MSQRTIPLAFVWSYSAMSPFSVFFSHSVGWTLLGEYLRIMLYLQQHWHLTETGQAQKMTSLRVIYGCHTNTTKGRPGAREVVVVAKSHVRHQTSWSILSITLQMETRPVRARL